MILNKFTQLNAIVDVWHPLYHGELVYIDINKIRRSKLDIKLRFSKVSEDSEYAGDWYLPRSKALKGRKRFSNNGRVCVSIPFKEFTKIDGYEDREF